MQNPNRNLLALGLLVLLALHGCGTVLRLGDHVGPTAPHALIEVAPSGKFSVAGRKVDVKAIDGIDLPYRPGKAQTFRVRPGIHVITYWDSDKKEVTSFNEMDPLQKSAALVTATAVQTLGLLGGGIAPLELKTTKFVYPTREIEVVADRRYYLKLYEIHESEIDAPAGS